jgi:energy-coupling factor transporter ATP-binding protein EcfA2
MNFLIRKPRGPWPKVGFPAFVLEQDNWNDYGFQTLYRLSYVTQEAGGKLNEDLIGPVKILRRGQSSSDGLLLTEAFNRLSPEFCSVGTSLDYYERLKALPVKVRRLAMDGLRDIVAKPTLANRFRQEVGWTESLFRDGKDEKYLTLARGLLTDDYSAFPGDELRFSFSMANQHATEFSFPSIGTGLSGATAKLLPLRVAVLVGKNGSGKSTMLARLARVAHGTVEQRSQEPLSGLGRITPSGIGFPRVVSVTFSPFDSFRLPGTDGKERRKVIKELAQGEGRFAFIGLRDIAARVSHQRRAPAANVSDGVLDADRLATSRLKSVGQLCAEFLVFLDRARAKKRARHLDKLLASVLHGSAFDQLLDDGVSDADVKEVERCFLLCSTGHKIAALAICGLVATLEKSSLILFDEPETHLHPPLLAALMHALRDILEKHQSFCVIATHSPVVVQESLGTSVKLVRREGTQIITRPPSMETFGESIGLITTEVFGLNAETTDYHAILDSLVGEYHDHEQIESKFLNGSMSHQARAYVMSRLMQARGEDS